MAEHILCSSSVQVQHSPLVLSASAAAGNARQRQRQGHPRRSSRLSPVSKTPRLLSADLDIQKSIANVQKTLHGHHWKSGREIMAAVDNLKRLCIDHYFEEEIESAMDMGMDLIHSDDLLDATLSFRFMRETGQDVSADDVLRKFTNGAGEFSLALTKDIWALLSLNDMSHLVIGEEASLHKAREFSGKHLASATRYLEPGLARYVRQSLEHPYHLSLMQYKARHYLIYLQSLPNRKTTAMEELAVAEFRLNKLLHQKEMEEIKRWWMALGLAQEIPVARDQLLKWYMWSVAILQGSSNSFSRYRVELTKIISLIYVVDDLFDLVGTQEELSLFTEAIKMWNTSAADSLPNCMRSCYKALCTITTEIADVVQKDHGINPLNHIRKAWAMLFDGFMVESKWLSAGLVPAAEDYLRNGVVTSGMPLALAHVLFLLGHDHTPYNNGAAELTDHIILPAISCPGKILRLWDDMGSAKDEAQEGLDGSYRDFYLMENPRCTPADAEEHMRSLIAREWEELNRECFSGRNFSSSFTQACLNAARMVRVMYSYDKEQRLLVLEDYARMLLL